MNEIIVITGRFTGQRFPPESADLSSVATLALADGGDSELEPEVSGYAQSSQRNTEVGPSCGNGRAAR